MTAGRKVCLRCERKYKGRGEWNMVFDAGRFVGLLCPTCQTPEENAEAVIKEATVDYAGLGQLPDGRLIAPAKVND